MTRTDTGLFFGLLGPVAAWRDGSEIDLGPPQQRGLLALLLLHRNRVVSTDMMLDALWPAHPPRSAVQVVRSYVFRLRGRLQDGSPRPARNSPLISHPQGYELRLEPDQVDADRFEELVASARTELEGGRADDAAALFREALELMRGTPLADLPDAEVARRERERLEEVLRAAEEGLAEAQLAQGRHRELVPALRVAVRSHPLRERSWAQLMLALYRSGRQAEALAAYRAACRVLDHELGLAPGPQLRALERMILLHDDALQRAPAPDGRLPSYRTSFVGRDAELEAIRADLDRERLITLLGTPGAGKTRLAAELVARLRGSFGRSLWWVDLGSVPRGQVVSSVARQLEAREVPGQPLVELVIRHLHGAPSLLVLDNCEHVRQEAVRLAARVLEDVPYARILATSREALGLPEERCRRVSGLRVPPVASVGADNVSEHPAARLFADRAAAACVGFRIDEETSADVAEIVARLDGLPLAIELAASSLRSTSCAELAHSLRRWSRLAGEGRLASPRRQRTLEAAIAWSYELVPSAAQTVLRRIAVFPGSFDGAAAGAVAGGNGLDPSSVLPALTRLVEASLLTLEHDDDTPRYRMLHTVRAFARERAVAGRELEAGELRHRDAFAALVEDVYTNMTGSGLATWLPRARRDHENFEAALRWSLDRGDGDEALQIASGLFLFWFRTGFVAQGCELIDRALRLAGPASRWRARGLAGRAWLAYAAGDADLLAIARDGVAECERSGDPGTLAAAIRVEGYALIAAGALAEAHASVERARQLSASTGDEEGLAIGDQQLGNLLFRAGDLESAAARLLSARDRMRRLRGTLDAGWVLVELARVRLAQDRLQDAIESASQAVTDFRRRDDPRGVAAAFVCLGRAHAALGEPDRARVFLREASELCRRWGYSAEAQDAERASKDILAASPRA